jgi:ferredoxin
MKQQIFLLIFIMIMAIAAPGICLEEARFPRPEFTGDYQTPVEKEPGEPSLRNPYLALLLLLVALIFSAHSLLLKRSRSRIQITGLLCLAWFGYVFKGCVCSIGSIQNIFAAIFVKGFPLALHLVAVFFLPLIFALFFGRIFCGSACPFGVLQDLVIFKPQKVPRILDRCLRLIPFAFLGLAIWFAASGMGFLICQYDPFVGIFRGDGPAAMLVAGAILLLLGTVIARPYCRYLCPYSVLLSATSLITWKRVQVYKETCVNCSLCTASCPVDAIIPGNDPSSPNAYAETHEQATGRLKWLVALSPALIALGMFTGLQLGEAVADMHDLVILQKDVMAQKNDADNVEAFFVNDGNVERLNRNAKETFAAIKKQGGIFGAYMSLVVIGSIFMATRRKINRFHRVEPWNCVSCGRCYNWCPQNLEKKK